MTIPIHLVHLIDYLIIEQITSLAVKKNPLNYALLYVNK